VTPQVFAAVRMGRMTVHLGGEPDLAQVAGLSWCSIATLQCTAAAIEPIVKAVEPFEYDQVYGPFWDMVIERDGQAVVKRSAEWYLRAIGAFIGWSRSEQGQFR
jgi:hypothetical protein